MKTPGLKILIPWDGSSTSEVILPVLLPLLRSHQVETTLLHVTGSSADEDSAASRLDVLRQGLEAQGVPSRILVHSGNAARDIVETATTRGFDLIAMGTHGRTRMDRIIMGSVAEEVVRTSPIPILLARPNCRMGSWERMIVALDGTPSGEGILEDVVCMARALRASVHLVRVRLPEQEWDDFSNPRDAFPRPDMMEYLNTVAGRLQERGIPASVAPMQGNPGDEIPRLAGSLGAGLICMATEGRPESIPGIGNSTTAEVIGKSPCAVYVRHLTGVRKLRREGV